MNKNIRLIKSQAGFRFQSIVFAEDGSASINIQMGTLSSKPATLEGGESEVVFTPIAQQGHWLDKSEIDGLSIDVSKAKGELSFRDMMESKLEEVFRKKGLLPV